MMSQCCVSSCCSDIQNSVLFHIPKDIESRDWWLQCLLPHNLELGNLSKRNLIKELVCNKHFEREFLDENGRTLLSGYPSLFTENEIVHGIPLGTYTDKKKGDHTYSRPPDELPTQSLAVPDNTTSKLNLKNYFAKAFKVNESTSKSQLTVKEEVSIKKEIILLDHEEIDELTIGPMAPLAPLLEKKPIVKSKKCKTANKTEKLYKPRASEKGPFKCQYCNRWFQAKHLVVKHERVHTNERPYVCEICNRGFNQLGTLIKHRQTHTDERPHVCNICGKDFKYKWCYKEHVRSHDSNHHLMCEICSETFVNRSSLWLHIRFKHTTKNKCDICNENFPNYHKLQKHKLTHTSHNGFKCSICNSTYSSKSYLKVHLLKHKYQ